MKPSSVRAQSIRDRIAEWWANAWRWVLMAAGAALAIYLLLERVQNGSIAAGALALLVI